MNYANLSAYPLNSAEILGETRVNTATDFSQYVLAVDPIVSGFSLFSHVKAA